MDGRPYTGPPPRPGAGGPPPGGVGAAPGGSWGPGYSRADPTPAPTRVAQPSAPLPPTPTAPTAPTPPRINLTPEQQAAQQASATRHKRQREEVALWMEIRKGLSDALNKDYETTCRPDLETPFRDRADAFRRLVPYHIYYVETPDDDQMDIIEDEWNETIAKAVQQCDASIMDWTARFEERCQALDAPRVSTLDAVMVERMFLEEERLETQRMREARNAEMAAKQQLAGPPAGAPQTPARGWDTPMTGVTHTGTPHGSAHGTPQSHATPSHGVPPPHITPVHGGHTHGGLHGSTSPWQPSPSGGPSPAQLAAKQAMALQAAQQQAMAARGKVAPVPPPAAQYASRAPAPSQVMTGQPAAHMARPSMPPQSPAGAAANASSRYGVPQATPPVVRGPPPQSYAPRTPATPQGSFPTLPLQHETPKNIPQERGLAAALHGSAHAIGHPSAYPTHPAHVTTHTPSGHTPQHAQHATPGGGAGDQRGTPAGYGSMGGLFGDTPPRPASPPFASSGVKPSAVFELNPEDML